MAEEHIHLLPHLRLVDRSTTQEYEPRQGRGPTLNIPTRDRQGHGTALLNSLNNLLPIFAQYRLARDGYELAVPQGITIEFQSAPGFDLAFETLDLAQSGIELLNVRFSNNTFFATCYVPDGKLDVLVRKVTAYLNENTQYNKPKNAKLIDSIQSIGLATINALWTDDEQMPEGDGEYWWEIWVRIGQQAAADAFNQFRIAAEKLEIHVAQQRLVFPERIVTTIRASRSQLSQAIKLLNLIAEIRNVDKPPTMPNEITITAQNNIVNNLAERLTLTESNVSVAILDTGISRGHPLITGVLNQADLHSINPAWGVEDHHGHGTNMAGLTVYGDIRHTVSIPGPLDLTYRLESCKILAPNFGNGDFETFGSITAEAVYRCEIAAPDRKRVICKAVTSSMNQSGEPSSYSGAIDQLAFASDEEEKRLFIISAGNVPDNHWLDYPDTNQTYGIEQPAQAWNALTVGAYTEMQHLPATADYAGWSAIAPHGDLSPFSSTSCTWNNNWPIKPEVLFEGGNVAVDPSGTETELPTTLQLLTTNKNHTVHPLSVLSMTSASTALATRLAAKVYVAYPDIWPETTKGLFVHYADWTTAQKARYLVDNSSASRRHLLRTCGFGIPDEQSVLNSLKNRVCLIAQETIQPYKHEGSKGKMNELCVFQLPWPKEVLCALGEQAVQLRVTLSYFVEPSPEKRGWTNRYRYASHSLRFDLRRSAESEVEFSKRVNYAMREDKESIDSPDDSGWLLGDKLRRSGSIHSDRWVGMAIDLASRDHIAVYPVVGWWRQRVNRGKCESKTRFSLVISLEAADLDIDLYTEIKTQLDIPIEQQNIIVQDNEL